jgi:hypothetical protein
LGSVANVSCHLEPLAVEQWQRPGDLVGLPLQPADLQRAQCVLDTIIARTAERRPHERILKDGHADKGMRHLERTRYAELTSPGRAKPCHIVIVETDLASFGADGARDQVEQRGLPGAIGAENADNIAFGDMKADAVCNHQRTKALAQLLDRKKSHGRHRLLCSRFSAALCSREHQKIVRTRSQRNNIGLDLRRAGRRRPVED